MHVQDGVFTPAACALLHTAACSRGLGHALFTRSQPSTILETALGSYLDEIGDDSPYIEYWSRQEWKHIEAHADVDEKLAASMPEAPHRFPQNGHVLYLKVGPRVHGPTCVWDGGRFDGALTTVPGTHARARTPD